MHSLTLKIVECPFQNNAIKKKIEKALNKMLEGKKGHGG